MVSKYSAGEDSAHATPKILHHADSRSYAVNVLTRLADIARLQSGQTPFSHIRFDLHTLLDSFSAMWTDRLAEKSVGFTSVIEKSVPRYVHGDLQRLWHAMDHLLCNAYQSTHHGEVALRVSATCTKANKAVLDLYVIDTGCGFSAEDQTQFSDLAKGVLAFAESHRPGLEIVLAHKIVTLMKGELICDSDVGAGSMLHIRLPLDVGDVQHSDETVSDASVDTSLPALNTLNILLVEDHFANCMIIKSYLADADVRIVGTGRDAVSQAQKMPFDVILMDIHLPEMDGIMATQHIRQSQGPNQHTPIIALTANALEDERHRSFAAGMNEHVTKPIDPARLFGAMGKALASSEALRVA